MVETLHTIGGDNKCFQPHIEDNNRPSRWQQVYLHVDATKEYEVFPTWILTYSGRRDTPLDLLADTTFHTAQFAPPYIFAPTHLPL